MMPARVLGRGLDTLDRRHGGLDRLLGRRNGGVDRRVLAVVGLVLALLLSGCGSGDNTSQNGFVGSESGLTRIDPASRKPAPVIFGPSLAGDKKVSTGNYRDKVVVINVWGSWCPPCRKEAPDLVAASRQLRSTAQFVGVNIRDSDQAPAQAYVRAFGVPYPSIYDPDGTALLPFAGDLPLSAIPSTLIIDPEGRIAARVIGTVTATTLVQLINDIAKGK